MGGKRDNQEWDSNWEHPFPKILIDKRRIDIKEADITECMYIFVLCWGVPLIITMTLLAEVQTTKGRELNLV